jgi:two pore calcium channel protein
LEVIYHRNHERAKEAYVFYYRLRPARVVSFFVLVMLPVFEVPFWCKGEMPQPCGDPELYALSGIPYIKNWHSLLIQALCLTFLVFSTILQWYFLGKTFWTRPLSFCKVGLLAIMIVLVMIPAAGMYGPEATLLSMYIRFIIPIVFTRYSPSSNCGLLRHWNVQIRKRQTLVLSSCVVCEYPL